MGQRITGMTSGQSTFPVAPSMFKFEQHGKSGVWVSELLPHTAKVVDDITIIKTVNTDAINHDPAITFIQTGFQQPGSPSMGSWISYGIGSANDEPSGVRRIAVASARDQHRSAVVLTPVVERLSPLESSGCALPLRQRSSAISRRREGYLALYSPPHAR